jgi:hypothetical protein
VNERAVIYLSGDQNRECEFQEAASQSYSTSKLDIIDMNDFSLNMPYSKYLQNAPRFEKFVKGSPNRSASPNVIDINNPSAIQCSSADNQKLEVIADSDIDEKEAKFYNNFFQQFEEDIFDDIKNKFGGYEDILVPIKPIESFQSHVDFPDDQFQKEVNEKIRKEYENAKNVECPFPVAYLCDFDKTFLVATRKPLTLSIEGVKPEIGFFKEDPNQKYYRWTESESDHSITVIQVNVRNPAAAVDILTRLSCKHDGINAGGEIGDGSRRRRWSPVQRPKRIGRLRRGRARNKSYYNRSFLPQRSN